MAICSIGTFQANAGWTKLTDVITFPGSGRWGAQMFVLDNKVFIGGGYTGNFFNTNDFQYYDLTSNAWGTLNNLPGTNTSRTGGIAFVIDGKAYLGLGAQDYNNFNPMPTYLQDLWEYDASTDTWTQKADLPGGGVADAAVFIVNNKAYIVGGQRTGSKSSEVWEYNPSTNSWKNKADYPGGGIANATAFELDGKGYIVGGSIGTPSNEVYEYDVAADSWTQKNDYPERAIIGGVDIKLDGNVYIGTGADSTNGSGTGYSNYFYKYNAADDSWSYQGGMELFDGYMHATSFSVDNKAYLACGWKLVGGSSQQFYDDLYELDATSFLSIGKTSVESSTTLYPNPATDIVNIRSDKQYQNYSIYGMDGRYITSGSLIDNTINTSNIPTGQYILQLHSETYIHKGFLSIGR